MTLKIDLTSIKPIKFKNDINLTKKVSYIYGKNGTGKSTISKYIKDNLNTEYDVHVFQGFENIISSDQKLNAILLGEENNEINEQIKVLDDKIKDKENNITLKRDSLEKITKKYDALNSEKAKIEDKNNKLLSNIAASLKTGYNNIFGSNYKINTLKDDIKNYTLKLLSKEELENYENILNKEEFNAPDIIWPNIQLESIKEEAEKLLKETIEIIKINRLNSEEKIKFAKTGLDLHNESDVCTFCNNKISKAILDELNLFFKNDNEEQSNLKNNLEDLIKQLKNYNTTMENIIINPSYFYPHFRDDILDLNEKFQEIKQNNQDIVKNFIEKLEDKKTCINISLDLKEEEIMSLDSIKEEYEKLKQENNKINIDDEKEEAKEKLKIHYIYEKLNTENFLIKEKDEKQILINHISKEKEELENNIKNIEAEIDKINKEIIDLQLKTRNEKILVKNINKKLESRVSFKLFYKEEDGYYSIIENNVIRDVTALSTGEKNLIAFLYFIEKINEIKEPVKKHKLIVFDDPMNSNDDTNQYFIMHELNALKNNLTEKDKLIILTHNNHFYINMVYKSSKVDRFRLKRIDQEIEVRQVDAKNDFKTSYELLWQDLMTVYKEERLSVSLLLNIMRRIIETFTNFNCIDYISFVSKIEGFKKILDVNSHSIDDLDADIVATHKQNLFTQFKMCFEKNGYANHFHNLAKLEDSK